jgi:protoheme IX farnesyltransferase
VRSRSAANGPESLWIQRGQNARREKLKAAWTFAVLGIESSSRFGQIHDQLFMNTSANDRVGVHALSDVAASVQPWVQLAKPGVTRLVLITTLFGGLVAPGSLPLWRWAITLLGTALVVAAANALNMVYEADADALMERTRDRPLPRGRLRKEPVVVASFSALGIGLAGLLAVDVVAAALAALAFASYVWVYTPLKRTTPHALYIGAVPGAIPPLIGYASVSGGQLDSAALMLFALLAVWQVPHFLAIAMFRRTEYERAGFKVFTVCRSQAEVRRLMLVWSALLFGVSLLPVWLGMGGVLYAAIAVGFGLPFLGGAAYGLRASADDAWARSLFFASMPHLVVLFVGLAL